MVKTMARRSTNLYCKTKVLTPGVHSVRTSTEFQKAVSRGCDYDAMQDLMHTELSCNGKGASNIIEIAEAVAHKDIPSVINAFERAKMDVPNGFDVFKRDYRYDESGTILRDVNDYRTIKHIMQYSTSMEETVKFLAKDKEKVLLERLLYYSPFGDEAAIKEILSGLSPQEKDSIYQDRYDNFFFAREKLTVNKILINNELIPLDIAEKIKEFVGPNRELAELADPKSSPRKHYELADPKSSPQKHYELTKNALRNINIAIKFADTGLNLIEFYYDPNLKNGADTTISSLQLYALVKNYNDMAMTTNVLGVLFQLWSGDYYEAAMTISTFATTKLLSIGVMSSNPIFTASVAGILTVYSAFSVIQKANKILAQSSNSEEEMIPAQVCYLFESPLSNEVIVAENEKQLSKEIKDDVNLIIADYQKQFVLVKEAEYAMEDHFPQLENNLETKTPNEIFMNDHLTEI